MVKLGDTVTIDGQECLVVKIDKIQYQHDCWSATTVWIADPIVLIDKDTWKQVDGFMSLDDLNAELENRGEAL